MFDQRSMDTQTGDDHRVPVVSVITPVYNGQQYLAECIESVLAQTLTDWEYVILDNCSTDRTRGIAEEYARMDPRIRVRHNSKFLPMVANFNRAATLASPGVRYLKFLCADDLLLPECLKMMVGLAEANPKVTVVGSYKIWGSEGVSEGPEFPESVIPGREICRQFFRGHGLLGSQTNHLIRVVWPSDSPKLFDERLLANDIDLWVRMLNGGSDFGFVHQVLTFSRIHKEAVSAYSHLTGIGSLDLLFILMKYGATFFSEREFRSLLRRYRKSQARSFVRAWAKVWDRRPLRARVTHSRELGIRFTIREMIQALVLEASACVMSPVDLVRRVRRGYFHDRDVPTAVV